jgi:Vesicle coat complex, various subunits
MSGGGGRYRAELNALTPAEWPDYLLERSGLPGPRANIELARAVADEGDRERFDRLIAGGEEYLVFCGVLGLGRLLAEGADDLVDRLRAHATDSRWRIREAVAMALQRLGDADPPRLLEIAAAWVADPHPLVRRAAVASLCEPRLLRTPAAAAAAVEVCARATDALAALPREERRDPDVRVLRQALGYCWSVAVAADPGPGLPRFQALAGSADADIAWIVRENRKKARLAKLL